MALLSKIQAQKICSDWHSGSRSAFYQFASSGEYVKSNHDRYIQEIEEDIKLAAPVQKNKLKKLKEYFIYKKLK